MIFFKVLFNKQHHLELIKDYNLSIYFLDIKLDKFVKKLEIEVDRYTYKMFKNKKINDIIPTKI